MVTWRIEVFSYTLHKWVAYGYHDYGSYGDANEVCMKLQSVGYKVRITKKGA